MESQLVPPTLSQLVPPTLRVLAAANLHRFRPLGGKRANNGRAGAEKGARKRCPTPIWWIGKFLCLPNLTKRCPTHFRIPLI